MVDGRVESEAGPPAPEKCALVLTGGGARGVYQVGVLRYLSERFPDASFPIITGVSAGSINAACLAAHQGTLAEATAKLGALWGDLTTDRIFESEHNLRAVGEFILRNIVPGRQRIKAPGVGALLSTDPLRQLLEGSLKPRDGIIPGIAENIESGRLEAIAIVTTNYTTGRTVTWVQGRDCTEWERPNRVAIETRISLDHVMASTALPILFPATRLGKDWYGDGGIRLTTPLSPALHLGADRILAVSTRYGRTVAEAKVPDSSGYPPPARITGLLLNAIFLDNIEQDAMNLERINRLVREIPESRHDGLRVVETMVLRPSRDLGKLAKQHTVRRKGAFRILLRIMGVDLTRTADLLSMIHFEPAYMKEVMEIGYEDAYRRREELEDFLKATLGAMA